jgi:hypothetical protein
MRQILAWGTAVFLATACAETAAPGDLIRTSDDAIKIAQRQCAPFPSSDSGSHWVAYLHDQTWQVSYGQPGPRDPCPFLSVTVRASDGFVWDGSQFVSAQQGSRGCVLCVS